MADGSLLGFMRDPQARDDVRQGFWDAINRGAVGGLLGAPADMLNMGANAIRAGAGYVGHKTGLLRADQMPELVDHPALGSEWWGKQMQRAGMVSPKRNEMAEGIAGATLGTLLPAAPVQTGKALAGTAGLLGAATADAGAGKAIFAGAKSATADKAALAKAQKLAADKADPRQIHAGTGWFKGADGQWRYEIDDSGAMFNASGSGGKLTENAIVMGHDYDLGAAVGGLSAHGTAGSMLTHQPLFDAYGGLTKSTRVGNKNSLLGDGVQGAYDPAAGTITINAPATAADARSTMLHELQHAVQGREGFAVGGSPDAMRQEALAILRQNVADGSITDTAEAMRMLPMAQHNAYQRLAGEVEARAVQKRMNYSPEQRRAVYPPDDYDVPVGSQIVKFDSAGAQESRGSGGLLFDPRFDPRVLERDRLRSLTTQVEARNTQPAPAVSLSDFEGHPFITSMSDRTAAGGLLTGVNGTPLNRPVDLRGGQDFMFDNNKGMVWASAPTPVNAIMSRAKALKDETGKDPLFLPWRMAPSGGDFAAMTGETMLSYADAAMGKRNKAALDKAARQLIPSWTSVSDPASVQQFREAPDATRKALKNLLDVEFRDKKGLSIGEARLAVADRKQLLGADGGTMNVGRVFADQAPVLDSTHPSYPRGVPGEGLGRLDREHSIFELMPDAAAVRGLADPRNPRATDLRALQMKPYAGLLDADLLKSLGY